MAEDLLETLTKFHRDVVAPEMERLVGQFRDEVRAKFDDVHTHFDAMYARFDRLADELQSLGAGFDRLERRVGILEEHMVGFQAEFRRSELQQEVGELKVRMSELQQRIAQIEADLRG